MSIIDNLITDRSAADTAALEALFAKARAGSLTEAEKAILADPDHKGAYNYTDLNRVSAALEYLRVRLEGYGYATPGYQRIEVPHKTASESKLPAGYTEVEYIESSGTQYIDTGFKPNQDTSIEMVVSDWLANETSTAAFGTRTSASASDNYAILVTSGDVVRSDYGSDVGKSFSSSVLNGSKVKITKNGNVATIGDSSVTNTAQTFSCGNNLALLCRITGGGVTHYASLKLYSCRMYDNGTLVRDFVPCINPDGAFGLYDVANGKFYGNAGTGAFISGAVVDPPVSPDDETRDPYLWYEDDIPTPAQMAQYLANVAAIRAVLAVLPNTPTAPGDMDDLAAEEANAIEMILTDVETLLTNMSHAFPHAGVTICGIQGGLIA